MILRGSLQLSCLVSLASSPLAMAAQPGNIQQVGSTLVSAMMMFLGSEDKVYILDKVEGNPTKMGTHPAWAAEWDIASSQARPMEVITNPFCSSGHHLPNNSYITFGGNGAIGPGGNISSTKGPTGTGFYDITYQDYDGEPAVRILNPCKGGDNPDQCVWYDNSTTLLKRRWYSTAEALGNGSVAIVGGFVNGGYINRNYPNTDPTYEGGAAEPTWELYPPTPNWTPPIVKFVVNTSGLNSYPHLFLMPSGKMFAQANYSTMLWDYDANIETPLPDMPGKVVRVYPASGGVAMLPLTPANNWTPTIIFCGGIFLEDSDWGDYGNPYANTWQHAASNDCQRITPEPTDGSPPNYVQDDPMLVGRTMGQFILLPDYTMLMVNGGANGTAGYATNTGLTLTYGAMPFGMSLAAEPVLTPAIYNPSMPAGHRWSNDGLTASTIPRLYHSSALLLPDGSVLIAGSNPNVDYNASTIYPTEYRAERFYPWYFGVTRPNPQGIPPTLSYGGSYFNITVDKSGYSGDANAAAMNSSVVIIRPGFTTHAMNMGQRFLELATNHTVDNSGTITLHVSQVPPNPNLLTPGPVLLFVLVNGVPSNGTMVTVGTGQIGVQPTSAISVLPPNTNATVNTGGSGANNGNGGSGDSTSSSGLKSGALIGIAAGAGALALVLGGLFVICMRRRKDRARAEKDAAAGYGASYSGVDRSGNTPYLKASPTQQQSDAFIPLQQYNNSAYNVSVPGPDDSQADLHSPHGLGAQAHAVNLPPRAPYYSDEPRQSYETGQTSYSGKDGAAGGYGYAVNDDGRGGYDPYNGDRDAKPNHQYDDQYYDAPPPSSDPRFRR